MERKVFPMSLSELTELINSNKFQRHDDGITETNVIGVMMVDPGEYERDDHSRKTARKVKVLIVDERVDKLLDLLDDIETFSAEQHAKLCKLKEDIQSGI